VSDKPFDGDFAGNYENLAGHATVNLDFSYQIERFRVSARVNNLLDAHYSEAGVIAFDFRQAFPSPQVETWYPSPGRNFMLAVRYNYQ
jgi:outer membrane receptor protein involved in Fe transport